MAIFIQKNRQELKLRDRRYSEPVAVDEHKEQEKTTAEMTTQEKIDMANEVLGKAPRVKRIKSDKGLIERAESEKTILMEDNRELLTD